MNSITPTLTIQLDNKVVLVSNSSAEVQKLVQYLDDWRQKEADVTSELLMIKSAIRDLQNVLTTQINADNANAALQEAEAAANESADQPVAE